MQILGIVLVIPLTWLGLGFWLANLQLTLLGIKEMIGGINFLFNALWRIPINIFGAYLVWKMFAWVYPMAWGGGA